jgi:hypothetical protein
MIFFVIVISRCSSRIICWKRSALEHLTHQQLLRTLVDELTNLGIDTRKRWRHGGQQTFLLLPFVAASAQVRAGQARR